MQQAGRQSQNFEILGFKSENGTFMYLGENEDGCSERETKDKKQIDVFGSILKLFTTYDSQND